MDTIEKEKPVKPHPRGVLALQRVYPLAMCLVLAAYGRWLGHRLSLSAAGLILASWLIWSGWRGYRSVRHLVAGLDYIAMGMLSFALA